MSSTPATSDTITIPKSDLEGLFAARRELEQFRSQFDARVKAEADAQLAEAAKDKADAVNQVRAQADQEKAQLTGAWLTTERDRAIGSAMAGVEFTSLHAASQAAALLASEVEAVLVDGKPITRARSTGLDASSHVRSRLASPEFAHFLKPRTTGGAAAPAAVQSPVPESPPANYGQALLQAHRAKQADPSSRPRWMLSGN